MEFFGGGGAYVIGGEVVVRVIHKDHKGVNTVRDYKTLEDKAALPLPLKHNQDTNTNYCDYSNHISRTFASCLRPNSLWGNAMFIGDTMIKNTLL